MPKALKVEPGRLGGQRASGGERSHRRTAKGEQEQKHVFFCIDIFVMFFVYNQHNLGSMSHKQIAVDIGSCDQISLK